MPRIAQPIATQKRHNTRQEIVSREIKEASLKAGRDDLTPPLWLNDAAREVFQRVGVEDGKIGLLDIMDKSVLAVYADAYAQYQEAAQHLKIDGLAPDGKINPFQRVATDAAKIILQCSSKLGLAATDRLKLAVPKQAPPPPAVNKWLAFLPENYKPAFENE